MLGKHAIKFWPSIWESMQLNFKMHHRWGKQSKFILILMIKTTLVRNNHKFTLNKLLVGSIYLEASQGIVVDLKYNTNI